MTENGSEWIADGGKQALHGFFFGHFQIGVNRCNYEIKARQYVISIIQVAVVKNVTFYTFKYFEWCEAGIELVNVPVLFNDTIFFQPVCIERAFAMVADHQVFKSFRNAYPGHFFYGMAASAPGAVGVNDPFNIARL